LPFELAARDNPGHHSAQNNDGKYDGEGVGDFHKLKVEN